MNCENLELTTSYSLRKSNVKYKSQKCKEKTVSYFLPELTEQDSERRNFHFLYK